MTGDAHDFLPPGEFRELAALAAEEIARLHETARQRPLGTAPSRAAVRDAVAGLTAAPAEPEALVRGVIDTMTGSGLDTAHPRCFGWLNPTPRLEAVVGNLVAAGINGQLARWDTQPAAVETERHLVRAVGKRFGYGDEEAAGAFTGGGAEANLSAIVLALTERYPDYVTDGLSAATGRPRIYASAQAHHSLEKAAVAAGLGREALRWIPVDADSRMDPEALRRQIEADRSAGDLPVMVVATMGTTNLGVIDPMPQIADVCDDEGLWLHADAAYGGVLAFTGTHRGLLAGVERAASITFDPHKFLSMPFGCGMLLTRRRETAARAFGISAAYAQADAGEHPYTTSMQWTRRFAGLPLLFTVALHGWDGIAAQVDAQLRVGVQLADRVAADGWAVDAVGALPVVCFHDPHLDDDEADAATRRQSVVRTTEAVNASGRAWVASTEVPGAGSAIRASVTSYRTTSEDIDVLIEALRRARASARETRPPARGAQGEGHD
jgi:aromatic-L-amino-acid/L-tryptophan decarboxylase